MAISKQTGPDQQTLARLDEQLASSADEALKLLRDLVTIQSVNPRFPGVAPGEYDGGERTCVELLAEKFTALGFVPNLVECEPGRPNLAAVLAGRGGGRSLGFNGHVDTVAPIRQEAWSVPDPWRAEERDGIIYGLGACDMKGAFAAMWLAARALRDAGIKLDGDLQVHAVVGEETMSHEAGTTAVLRAGFKPDGVIVGEPSSSPDFPLAVTHTAAGNLNFRIRVKGKPTHWGNRALAIRPGGEGAAIGVNAIDKLMHLMSAVRDLEDRWGHAKSNEYFPPGFFIIHPGVVHGDIGIPAPAYFPDDAFAHYLLWYPPQEDPEDVRAELEATLAAASEGDAWLSEHPAEVEWLGNWPAAESPVDSSFVRTVIAARNTALPAGSPKQSDGAAFGAASDASFYEAFGIPAVACGPGDIRLAHSIDERVAAAEILHAARIYAHSAMAWCGSPNRNDRAPNPDVAVIV